MGARTRAFATLGILLALTLTRSAPASADVFVNARVPATFELFNPCAPEDGLIALAGEIHTVGRTAGDGTTIFQNNGHFAGTSASGLRYEVTVISVFTSGPGPASSSYVRRVTIGQGPGGNHRIVLTFTSPPPAGTTDSECRG